MQSFRCLFTVESITHFPSYSQAKLAARYDLSIPEDQRFYAATPSGDISITFNTPRAVEALVPGAKFYVDFSPLPVVEQAGS